jgi:hypothetical protein
MEAHKQLVLVAALGTLLSATAFAAGSQVVKEVVLHVHAEDITYVSNGPFERHVAFLEDMKVLGYPLSRGKSGVKTLFDFSAVQPTFRPNGLAYMDTEKRFAVVTRNFPRELKVLDAKGKLKATRTIEYPDGYEPNFVEGLAYIPPGADWYPDHLALCTGQRDPVTGSTISTDILILTRAGAFVDQVHIASDGSECLAVAFQPPDRLVVSGADGDYRTITTIDFDGNPTGSSAFLTDSPVEGLVAVPGDEWLAIGDGGIIYSLDRNLDRQPQRDRVYRANLGLEAYGLAWAGVASEPHFVVSARAPVTAEDAAWALFTLSSTLDDPTMLAGTYYRSRWPYYPAKRLSFIPSEALIAMCQARRNQPGDPRFVPGSIQLFEGSNGDYVSEVNLEALQDGDPIGIAWMAEHQQFAVSFSGKEPGIVSVLNRAGEFVRDVDYSATITARVTSLTFFNPSHPSGGQLLLSTGPTLFVGDLHGNITRQFSATEFAGMTWVVDLATVTEGDYQGTFAAKARSQWGMIGKLVIFRVDAP